jgi:hypothetical protein
VQTLRERGHYERYLEELPPEHHDAILLCVAGQWLPMPLARAHYEACDRLRLSVDEQLQMGMSVSIKAQRSVLGTVVRMARDAGVTPWSLLEQTPRFWKRGVDAGAVGIAKQGPKDAFLDLVGCELFAIPYFRTAFRGVVLDIASLFCTKAYLHEKGHGPAELQLRLQWA